MKSIKMHSLAVIGTAMAMALFTASVAGAENTQLCKVDENPCAVGNAVTHVHKETLVGAKAKVSIVTGSIDCALLYLGDSLGLGAPLVVHGHVTFTECKRGSENCTAEETGPSTLIEVLRLGHDTADSSYSFHWNFHCGFIINCTYDGENLLGTGRGPLLAASENGEDTITEQTLHKVSGTFCPETAKLSMATMPLEKVYISQ